MNPVPELHRILQSFPAFSQLDPDTLAGLSGYFEEKTLPEGRDIFHEKAVGKYFYLLVSGAVSLWRQRGDEEEQTALLGPGDAFGEEALSDAPLRSVTAYAESETVVLRATAVPLREALAEIPTAREVLHAMIRANGLVWRMRFPWLEPEERVYYATRKAQALLAPGLVLPVLILLASIGGMLYLAVRGWPAWAYLVPVAGLLIAVVLGVWQAMDWSNDFYLITSRRIVSMRRIPLIYDDRQEAPIGMIQSVSVSSSVSQRMFGFGNVVVRTFTRPIVFDSVPDPHMAARLVEAVWKQSLSRKADSDRGEIERMLAERLEPRADGEQAETPVVPSIAEPAAPPADAWQEALGRFQTRLESGDTVTYRKHAFFLVRNVFLPILLVLVGAVLAVLMTAGVFPVDRLFGLAVGTGVSIAGLLWGIYEYMDWSNDLYQVTSEQILALHRRPLGDEERRAAALENILSLEYDRPSLLARLLDFGTVNATVGQVNFTFDEVRDPVHVQEDIFRRMEARKKRREDQQRRQRREEIADWIDAYHQMTRAEGDGPQEESE